MRFFFCFVVFFFFRNKKIRFDFFLLVVSSYGLEGVSVVFRFRLIFSFGGSGRPTVRFAKKKIESQRPSFRNNDGAAPTARRLLLFLSPDFLRYSISFLFFVSGSFVYGRAYLSVCTFRSREKHIWAAIKSAFSSSLSLSLSLSFSLFSLVLSFSVRPSVCVCVCVCVCVRARLSFARLSRLASLSLPVSAGWPASLWPRQPAGQPLFGRGSRLASLSQVTIDSVFHSIFFFYCFFFYFLQS